VEYLATRESVSKTTNVSVFDLEVVALAHVLVFDVG
jgi:hypothetical protein